MILDFISGDYTALKRKLIALFIIWFAVIVAVSIDLYFGVKKSKAIGDFVHSYGLRQTVKKLTYYLALMAFMLLLDTLSPLGLVHEVFAVLPLASSLCAIALVVTEFISVKEKADQKFVKRTSEVANELLKMAVESPEIMNTLKEKLSK